MSIGPKIMIIAGATGTLSAGLWLLWQLARGLWEGRRK